MDWSQKLAAALSRPQGFDWDATKRLADFQTMADGAPVGAVGAPGGLSPYGAPADPFSAQDALAALSFAPVFGDVAGLAGDAAMYATDPESRTAGNYAMTAAGALPFVPSAKAAMLAKALAVKAGGLGGVVGMAGKALNSLSMSKQIEFEPHDFRRPGSIEPPHEVRDAEKLSRLTESMKNGGWQGRPILAYDIGNGPEALTGSHRIMAARNAGLDEIPISLVDSAIGDYADEAGNTIRDVSYWEPHDIAKWLDDFGDKSAADLLMQDSDMPHWR